MAIVTIALFDGGVRVKWYLFFFLQYSGLSKVVNDFLKIIVKGTVSFFVGFKGRSVDYGQILRPCVYNGHRISPNKLFIKSYNLWLN